MIHCLLFNVGSSSKKRRKKCVIVSRHCLTNKTRCQTNLIRLNQCFRLITFFFNSRKMEHFIYKGGCGIHMCIEVLKKELAWAIDKQFHFTIS